MCASLLFLVDADTDAANDAINATDALNLDTAILRKHCCKFAAVLINFLLPEPYNRTASNDQCFYILMHSPPAARGSR
ncbi:MULTISPECIES: hypothetical protein [unclassified Herbaspirillum]|uniref:hypothetical protein n=1 Tax=unclassified Herbaspirillum TaxID=2624150 RepID=UPI002579A514|nr:MULTISPECIES: hypothetical protein [unclassified Herbaspirillum]|tara:strand:- start:944 stop:1177 length:234 start_codon:yes stop_codon:yes gene_type:complete